MNDDSPSPSILLADVLVAPTISTTPLISLSKLTKLKIVDVLGYASNELGGGTAFKVIKIVFSDRSTCWVEGEHDFPYLTDIPKIDEYALEGLYEQSQQ